MYRVGKKIQSCIQHPRGLGEEQLPDWFGTSGAGRLVTLHHCCQVLCCQHGHLGGDKGASRTERNTGIKLIITGRLKAVNMRKCSVVLKMKDLSDLLKHKRILQCHIRRSVPSSVHCLGGAVVQCFGRRIEKKIKKISYITTTLFIMIKCIIMVRYRNLWFRRFTC